MPERFYPTLWNGAADQADHDGVAVPPTEFLDHEAESWAEVF
jgi:hypothetical protein